MAALHTEDVLREEAKAIRGADLSAKRGTELYRSLNGLDTAALCLSGGGIRSAAFALGVIQSLAGHSRLSSHAAQDKVSFGNTPETSLLAQFHYLSTVSGGGYIGSWLTAWRARADFTTVWTNLIARPNGPDAEPHVINWLRSYSNYLTPRRGALSADSWATLALYIGNLVINWLIILPFICAAILALKIIAWFLVWFTLLPFMGLQFLFAAFGIICLIKALAFATRNRPSRQLDDGQTILKASGASQGEFLSGYLALSLLSAIALTQFFGSDLVGELFSHDFTPNFPQGKFVTASAIFGAGIYAIGWWAGRPKRRELSDLGTWTASGLAYGALIGLGFYLFLLIPNEETLPPALQERISWFVRNPVMYLLVGIPWCLASQFIAQIIFTGIDSYQEQADTDWEWLARAGGWKLATAVVLFLVILLIFPNFQDSTLVRQLGWIAPIGGASALLIAVIGKSRLSPGKDEGTGIVQDAANGVLAIAAPIFAATLIFVLSTGLDRVIFGASGATLFKEYFPMAENIHEFKIWLRLIYLFVATGICVLVGLAASWLFNINRFSLHAIYRNRLIRAFLGASSMQRRPDGFTDFDTKDNPRMHTLWPPRKGTGWQPFHVINMTLNIVSAKRLAWQERKAASFTVSPLHSGAGGKTALPATGAQNDGDGAFGAFRPTIEYGGRGDDPDRSGISLGTAMAISGAAASPNMGYHSSPTITLLMSMFNVRLGWWLGNPGSQGEDTYFRDGPAVAIIPLMQETFGLTTDDQKYIYLSDGGHFENLGLYEMVRRRCRLIVVVDAGCDPDFRLEDLGNAVRKIAIDLGITVRFQGLAALKKRPPDGSDVGEGCDYHAIGEILYRAADGGGKDGIILYVKAGYHGVESAGVRSFAISNRDFPHQSTADQWFNESRFESYRALGFEIMESVLDKALMNKICPPEPSLEEVLAALQKIRSASGKPEGDPKQDSIATASR